MRLDCRKSSLQTDVTLCEGFAVATMVCTLRAEFCSTVQPDRQLKEWKRQATGK